MVTPNTFSWKIQQALHGTHPSDFDTVSLPILPLCLPSRASINCCPHHSEFEFHGPNFNPVYSVHQPPSGSPHSAATATPQPPRTKTPLAHTKPLSHLQGCKLAFLGLLASTKAVVLVVEHKKMNSVLYMLLNLRHEASYQDEIYASRQFQAVSKMLLNR